MDAIIAIIWVVFMIVAGISAVIKKAKQQQQEAQARESAAKGTAAKQQPVYTAPEEDIRAFLEQMGAKPPPPAQPRPQQPQPVQPSSPQQKQQYERTAWDVQRDALMKKTAARKKARLLSAPSSPKATPSRRTVSEPDVQEVREAVIVSDPLMALTTRLSPIQRAVVWREILDSPPGLR